MDKNGKSRHSVWLSDEVWQEVDAFYKLDNCPTRNEFVEKALRQYCGRLHAERTSAYLPHALQEMLEGTLGVFGDRLGKLLFKLVVEHNMTNHLLGGDIDMTRDEYNKMRGNSVREVAGTHGNISFRDVLAVPPGGVTDGTADTEKRVHPRRPCGKIHGVCCQARRRGGPSKHRAGD